MPPPLQSFATYLASQALAPATVALYARTAARWERQGYVTPADAFEAIRHRRGALPPGTAAALKGAARHWYAWRDMPLPTHALKLRISWGGYAVPELDLEDCAILDRALARANTHDSVRGVLALQPWSGLRIAEACRLRPEDLQETPNGLQLRILGKRSKVRRVPIVRAAAIGSSCDVLLDQSKLGKTYGRAPDAIRQERTGPRRCQALPTPLTWSRR